MYLLKHSMVCLPCDFVNMDVLDISQCVVTCKPTGMDRRQLFGSCNI